MISAPIRVERGHEIRLPLARGQPGYGAPGARRRARGRRRRRRRRGHRPDDGAAAAARRRPGGRTRGARGGERDERQQHGEAELAAGSRVHEDRGIEPRGDVPLRPRERGRDRARSPAWSRSSRSIAHCARPRTTPSPTPRGPGRRDRTRARGGRGRRARDRARRADATAVRDAGRGSAQQSGRVRPRRLPSRARRRARPQGAGRVRALAREHGLGGRVAGPRPGRRCAASGWSSPLTCRFSTGWGFSPASSRWASFAVTAEGPGDPLEGMYIDAAGKHSLRGLRSDDDKLMIVGGHGHRLGTGDPTRSFAALRAYAHDRFGATGFRPPLGRARLRHRGPAAVRRLSRSGLRADSDRDRDEQVGTCAGRRLRRDARDEDRNRSQSMAHGSSTPGGCRDPGHCRSSRSTAPRPGCISRGIGSSAARPRTWHPAKERWSAPGSGRAPPTATRPASCTSSPRGAPISAASSPSTPRRRLGIARATDHGSGSTARYSRARRSNPWSRK